MLTPHHHTHALTHACLLVHTMHAHVHTHTHTHTHTVEDVLMRGGALLLKDQQIVTARALPTTTGRSMSMHLTQLNQSIILKNDPHLTFT